MTRFAASPEEWTKVAEVCRRAGLIGLDSETYGHDVRKSTPVHRARIHVWSVGVLSTTLHPRGHRVASGMVLPAAALDFQPIRDVLQDDHVIKIAHNAPHDIHSFSNHGVEVVRCLDSLPRAKLMFPGRQGHGLKKLAELVSRKLTEFNKMREIPNWVNVKKKRKICFCGDPECKESGRKKLHRKSEEVYWEEELRGTKLEELENIVPGHPNWAGLVEYAAEDAVCALELWDLMDKMKPRVLPPLPWAPNGEVWM
jgi:hypothetical protein